jgi:hypothetical protein
VESGDWTWLEVAKLVVASLVPLAVVVLGLPIARAARRLDQEQWADRKLIELRLELYAAMSRPLNDLVCFFRRVGDFQEITPPEALRRKRTLDKEFFVSRILMSEEFETRYHEFIGACFKMYTGPGRPAQLRASRAQQRAERPDWDDSWNELLIPETMTPTGLDELGQKYDALMEAFGAAIRVRSGGREDARPRRG